MAKKSITKRWIINNLGIIILALLVIEMVVIYAIQSYYYNSAKQYLVSKLNAVTSVLSIHSQDSSFYRIPFLLQEQRSDRGIYASAHRHQYRSSDLFLHKRSPFCINFYPINVSFSISKKSDKVSLISSKQEGGSTG